MRISDWSSDVCSSDLDSGGPRQHWMAIVDAPGETAGKIFAAGLRLRASVPMTVMVSLGRLGDAEYEGTSLRVRLEAGQTRHVRFTTGFRAAHPALKLQVYVEGMRSEEHTSELQSLMRHSYAVFCLKKKKT